MQDWQLIHEYVAQGSEVAFRTLVARHLNHVHATAFRQVADWQVAEEITQAVFILLARKAPRLPRGIVLGGWLYRTTRFVSARATRAEQRRKRREQEAFQMQQSSSPDDGWRRLAPLLDEGLEQLPEVERNALVLRFFQEKPLQEVGQNLGVSEEAARKRVTRSLEKLRTFFGRKGVTITMAALTAAMGKHAAEAAPSALSTTVASAALAHVAGGLGTLPVLAQETARAWRRTRIAWGLGIATTAAVLSVALITASVRTRQSSSKPFPQILPDSPAAAFSPAPVPEPQNAPAEPASADLPATHLGFRTVDAETDRPLPGARVLAVSIQDQEHIHLQTNLITDARGWCDVPLFYSNVMMLGVGALADGYEERCAMLGFKEPVPNEYVLKLPRGAQIGGVVQDESGNPVAGARLYVQFYGTGDAEWRESHRERPGFPADDIVVAATDASGRWKFGSASATDGAYYINVAHTNYPTASFRTEADEHGGLSSERIKAAELHAQTATLVLKSGEGIRGQVTTQAGIPVPGARVSFGAFAESSNPSTETGPDGSFNLKHLPAGQGYITIMAKHLAPERVAANVGPNPPPLTIRLQPGALLRLKVLDQAGNGVERARVQLQAWRGHNTLDWGGFTDVDGRIEWACAPRDEMDLCVMKEGFFFSRRNLLSADGEEHVITLHPQVTVSGFVTDSETGQPIEHFKAIPGSDAPPWQRINAVNGTNGQYQLTFNELSMPLLIRFEADGYEPAVSKPITELSAPTCDVPLKKQSFTNMVRGMVLMSDGNPASGAQVALCTTERGITLGRGKFLSVREGIVVEADAQGRFQFSTEPEAQTVIAVNGQGFCQKQVSSTERPMSLELQPWGRIEGHLAIRNRNNASQQITMLKPMGPYATAGLALDFGAFSTTTDALGNFVFEKVPPGDFNLFLNRGTGIPFSHQTPIRVKPGVTVQAQVGGTGSSVVGRLVLSDPARKVDWPRQVRFSSLATKSLPSVIPTAATYAEVRRQQMEFWRSEAGQERLRTQRSFPLEIEPDGSFVVAEVPPGEYELNVQVMDAPMDPARAMLGKPLGSVRQTVLIPEAADPQSESKLDVGDLTLQMH